ncbi:MAG: hypothetical protein JTT16_04820 [Candidatus Brockarchaeota archaeon]|nr:hypothetical protein [Candidatus Brockarchaeota archaeon]MBO3768609.1 hypothetical protein [Candidatus Brockarchaeota archaeon]
MKVAIFEDDLTFNFFPITLTRPSFFLKLGVLRFYDRVKIESKTEPILFTRDFIGNYLKSKYNFRVNDTSSVDDETLFINGLVLVKKESYKILSNLEPNTALSKNGRLVAVKFKSSAAKQAAELLINAPDLSKEKQILSLAEKNLEPKDVQLIENYWEIIEENTHQIAEDFPKLPKKGGSKLSNKVTVVGKKTQVFVGKNSEIGPNVVLDASSGPIYIGNNTKVHPFTWIQGPAYIGSETIIHPGSVIREGSNIGDVCRIGGEVEESIVQGFSNKPHAGFLGHAYVGEWVNLGALFTNSDLKNTYGSVKVVIRGKKVDSGTTKLGGMVGDHAKASIGSLLYTGKKIGVASQIHGVVEEDVPSFLYYAKTLGNPLWEIMLEAAIETAKRVMARRKVDFTEADKTLLTKVFELTQPERDALNPRKGPFSF